MGSFSLWDFPASHPWLLLSPLSTAKGRAPWWCSVLHVCSDPLSLVALNCSDYRMKEGCWSRSTWLPSSWFFFSVCAGCLIEKVCPYSSPLLCKAFLVPAGSRDNCVCFTVFWVQKCCVGGGKMAEMHMCFSRICTINNCMLSTDLSVYTLLWIYLLNALVARGLWPLMLLISFYKVGRSRAKLTSGGTWVVMA